MRSSLFVPLFALLLSACPAEEPVEDPDVIWVPALTSDDAGTLDLGELQVGVNVEEAINVTNNTDADILVTIAFDLDPAEGFWGSGLDASQDVTLAAGADYDINIKINPSQAGSVNGDIDFVFDNHVVNWTVTGTVVN